MREIDSTGSHRASFRGNVAVEDGDGGCDLLLVKRPLNEDGRAVTTVASLLARGGAVLADSCGSNDDALLPKALSSLATKKY